MDRFFDPEWLERMREGHITDASGQIEIGWVCPGACVMFSGVINTLSVLCGHEPMVAVMCRVCGERPVAMINKTNADCVVGICCECRPVED